MQARVTGIEGTNTTVQISGLNDECSEGPGEMVTDRLFTILMGGDLGQRRKYIEEHAFEVKYLDV